MKLPDRIEAKIRRLDSGCWEWTASRNRDGYAQVRWERRTRAAHRLIYELLVGPIAEGLTLDHICHNEEIGCQGGPSCPHRRCVNPAHLEPATHRQNILRGEGPAGRHARKSHCPSGHLYDEANTLITPRGHRLCRACRRLERERNRATYRAHYERHQEAIRAKARARYAENREARREQMREYYHRRKASEGQPLR